MSDINSFPSPNLYNCTTPTTNTEGGDFPTSLWAQRHYLLITGCHASPGVCKTPCMISTHYHAG